MYDGQGVHIYNTIGTSPIYNYKISIVIIL
jgi:hypothetical protein